MTKKHFWYVLKTKDNTLYSGYTIDLERRLREHNLGIGAKYTRPKTRRPVEMIYHEEFATRSEAQRAESLFKMLSRLEKNRFLEQNKI